MLVAFQDGRNLFAIALRSAHAIFPAQMLKVVAALLVITETIYQLTEVNGFCHKVTHATKEVKEAPDGNDGRRSSEAFVPS